MKNILFIGRFQPFHNGHLSIIKKMIKSNQNCIIGIGSSQYDKTKQNPFTAEERIKMINQILESEKIYNYQIVLIPDINNYPKWVEHVQNILKQNELTYDEVWTGNNVVEELFNNAKKKVIKIVPDIKISSSKIRQLIIDHDPLWKKYINPLIQDQVQAGVLQYCYE